MYRVLVIIPCYNEEKNIEKVINDLNNATLKTAVGFDFIIDYIIVNDCSLDGTLDICKNRNYNYLNLPINLGIGGCVQAGYKYAYQEGYDIAIQHDGDGQHDPHFFSDVISPIISEDADIVIGSRFLNKDNFKSTRLRRLGISFLSKLIHLCTGAKIYDATSGYRAVNRKYIKIFVNRYAQDYPEPEAIVDAAKNKARIKEIPVTMYKRGDGTSSINALKSLYYMIKVSLAILLHRIIVVRKDAD